METRPPNPCCRPGFGPADRPSFARADRSSLQIADDPSSQGPKKNSRHRMDTLASPASQTCRSTQATRALRLRCHLLEFPPHLKHHIKALVAQEVALP